MDARYRIAKILICALLPLCVAPVLKAQSLMDGQMEVRNLAVSRQEDKLFVSLDLDVSALKVGTNREVVFAPHTQQRRALDRIAGSDGGGKESLLSSSAQ